MARMLRRISVTLLVTAVVALSPAGIAMATNFGSQGTAGGSIYNNGVWLTNNSTLLVTRLELSSAYSTAVQNVLMSQYDPTHLSVSISTTASFAGYDICYMDYTYGDGFAQAWTYCAGTTTGSHPNQRCSRAFIIIDNVWNPPATPTICHETGHAVGLRHSAESGSCMTQSLSATVLTDHDRAHIDAAY